ncbi:hypothetical protein [Streptomyces roseicoloratus]|uniref:Secreted protein n=1 Tax=Streptomyces roseicoloratus TaxID=2508722 RepID=A0ABY9RYJ4_9ACTN|nr:hypothetical protein [Streptomyces roseicoloratus]WMX46546.1 hypothetical protein RGF97_19230 [Streptomyces roseicoloratus]
MKLRHVRAIAVFGIALVALTGARGSHGGSCGGGSSSHGSSGSDHSSSGSDGSSSSSSGGSTGSVSGVGGSSRDRASRDVKIDECTLSADGKNLVAKLTITNSDSSAYLYDVTMQFKGDAGKTAGLAIAEVDDLRVEGGASKSTEATTPYTGSGNGSEYTRCEVAFANRTMG